MDSINWERYPRVAAHSLARDLLLLEASLGHAANTLDAYARGREDFFAACALISISPDQATREHVALWVRELTTRSTKQKSSSEKASSAKGVSNATLHQRLTAVRLFFDFLIEKGARADNPVGRGRYTPGKSFGGCRQRGLVPRHHKLPWIPNDEQWEAILKAIKSEPLRNRAMFALGYDAALRREELCLLEIADFDFACLLLRVRAETTKSRRTRVVPFSPTTSLLLGEYLRLRRRITTARGPVFISESPRNIGEPISIWTWSKVAARIASVSTVSRFSTHTLRHLCLTDLARSGWDIHEIATFAGHRSLETTKDYIHLSGRDLAEKLQKGMAQVHAWRIAQMTEQFQ
jgi:site-specific recombinase XerD